MKARTRLGRIVEHREFLVLSIKLEGNYLRPRLANYRSCHREHERNHCKASTGQSLLRCPPTLGKCAVAYTFIQVSVTSLQNTMIVRNNTHRLKSGLGTSQDDVSLLHFQKFSKVHSSEQFMMQIS